MFLSSPQVSQGVDAAQDCCRCRAMPGLGSEISSGACTENRLLSHSPAASRSCSRWGALTSFSVEGDQRRCSHQVSGVLFINMLWQTLQKSNHLYFFNTSSTFMWRFPEIGVLHGIPLYHLFQWDFLIFPNKNHPFGGTPIYGSPQIINHRWNSFIWTMAVLACISCRPRCAASAKERWAASLCCCTWASNFQLVASQKLYGYNKNQSYSIKPSRNTGKN